MLSSIVIAFSALLLIGQTLFYQVRSRRDMAKMKQALQEKAQVDRLLAVARAMRHNRDRETKTAEAVSDEKRRYFERDSL